ncbi:MAG: sulfur carrier protein ThiS [Gammaproteobacteria bacterium]|nr:MAG: sulfur carrier protein ThiS [Gammaproteobacteria bacterium]
MNIILNGETRAMRSDTSLSDLITELDLTNKRIAIEVNREIIPRGNFHDHELQEGDKIEIVHAIGGG